MFHSKSHPACELLCAFWAPFQLLTCCHEIPSRLWVAVFLLGSTSIADMLPWNPIQAVSCCVPPGLHFNCWHAALKSHPVCELLCAWAPFQLLTCWYEIFSRLWVTMFLLGSISIADILLLNPIQGVSCHVPSLFHLNYWHITIPSCLVCAYFLPSTSLYSVNKPVFCSYTMSMIL